MKRSINNECDQLFEKLSTYVVALNFKLLNLCIKAEETSLIPVTVTIDGVGHNLEDVAIVSKKDEYRFWIVPNYDEDLDDICQGVASVHPEFKQKIDSFKLNSADVENQSMEIVERDVTYLQLTMPEVDDKRYEALKDGVDFFYNECKLRMDTAIAKATSVIAVESVGEPLQDIELVKKTMDQIKERTEEQRDKLRDKKLKEIEDAYQEWLNRIEINKQH